MGMISRREYLCCAVLLCWMGMSWMFSEFVNPEQKWMPYSFLRTNASRSVSPTPPPASFISPSAESEELRTLTQLITWPEPRGALNFRSSTSPQNCDYRILHPKAQYSVGDILEVVLTAKDHQMQTKTYGGDFFRAKLHSPSLKAGVTGSVKDHQNGTYMITFLLPWPGDVEISIRLIHSSEAVHIMKYLRESRSDKVYFKGYFQRNGASETTECNVEIPNQPVCDYQDVRTGERWVCVRPKRLPCSAYIYHIMGGYKRITTQREDEFFQQAVTDQVLQSHVTALRVLAGRGSLVQTPACTPGLEAPQPSGFYYNDVWTSLVCKSKRFSTPPEASACLKGKIVYMFGDSTLRQWWEYLLDFIPSLKRIDLHVGYQSGPLLAVDPGNGLALNWRGHGNPLRTAQTMIADLHYMANDIAGIGGGPDIVIVFTAWAHFTSFPVEVYIRRLRNIRRAVMELLQRSPQTMVIIKSANTGYKSLIGSDWLSLQLDVILRKMFSGLPVAVVDAWDMTSCHYLSDNIHPGKIIVQNEVDMFLSFICPH